MKLASIVALFLIVGVALSLGSLERFKKARLHKNKVDSAIWGAVGDIFDSAIKDLAKVAGGVVIDKFTKETSAVMDKIAKESQDALDKMTKGIKDVLDPVTKGTLKVFDAVVDLGSGFANEMKAVATKLGNTLDLKLISLDDLKKVLKGVQSVTGPIEKVINNPAIDLIMSNSPLAPSYIIMKVIVKAINDPTNVQKALLESHPMAKVISNIITSTVKDPDNFAAHIFAEIPEMGPVLAEMAKAKQKGKLLLEEKVKSIVKNRIRRSIESKNN